MNFYTGERVIKKDPPKLQGVITHIGHNPDGSKQIIVRHTSLTHGISWSASYNEDQIISFGYNYYTGTE